MRRLIEEIMNNNYVSADELFRTGMSELVEHIVLESKKIVASQMVEEKKNDHDYDDPPFDPDKKKSTPWKNPHSKAKHLAREMMKKYRKKEKKLDEAHSTQQLKQAKVYHKAVYADNNIPGNSEKEYNRVKQHGRAANVAAELIARKENPNHKPKKWSSFKKGKPIVKPSERSKVAFNSLKEE